MVPFRTAFPMTVPLVFLVLAGNTAYVSFVLMVESSVLTPSCFIAHLVSDSTPALHLLNFFFNVKPSLHGVSTIVIIGLLPNVH